MKNYKEDFVSKFGVDAWEADVCLWESRGRKINEKTGLLEKIQKGEKIKNENKKYKVITLESLYTPYTIDRYQAFTFESAEEYLLSENGGEYDDYEWDYLDEEYTKELARNCIKLLKKNIVDDVILDVNSDCKVISPEYYNFTTDKIFIDFTVNLKKLKDYVEKNKDLYEKEKLKSYDGFMWFGNENETMLNFYLRKVSGEKYEPYDYYQDQVESIDATEYVKIV